MEHVVNPTRSTYFSTSSTHTHRVVTKQMLNKYIIKVSQLLINIYLHVRVLKDIKITLAKKQNILRQTNNLIEHT